MVTEVIQGTKPSQGVARMMGVKSMRILHHEKLYMELNMIKDFLERELEVPEYVKQSHLYLLKTEGNILFKPTEAESVKIA